MKLINLKLVWILIVVSLGNLCQANEGAIAVQNAGGAGSDGNGFSRAGLTAIQEMMDTAIADGRISAGVAMLARDGSVVWQGIAGEMTPGIPMRSDAIMPLASVGKIFTATAAMILYERGLIAFDDPVSKYIPEFANVMVGVKDEDGAMTLVEPEIPITVYHLLTHTGGLTVTGDGFWAAWDEHTGRTTTTHLARALAAMPLFAQPGTQFRYGQTGASYEVLGAVIEIASGRTLEAFMSENIFKPLDLKDTYFYLPDEKSERLPAVYRKVDGVLQLDRPYGEDFPRSTFFHGGGGVRSAPKDIQRFMRLFLNAGSVDGVRILQAETISLMLQDHLGEKAPERWKARGLSWGFGAAVIYSEEDIGSGTPGQYGWVGGGFAKLWIEPKEQLIAYFNFPMDPPGDNDLLVEFGNRVKSAKTEWTAAIVDVSIDNGMTPAVSPTTWLPDLKVPWQTHESITTGGWGYTTHGGKSDRSEKYVDFIYSVSRIVSYVGVYLLNVGPRSDVTIPESQVNSLWAIGEWLEDTGAHEYTYDLLTADDSLVLAANEKVGQMRQKSQDGTITIAKAGVQKIAVYPKNAIRRLRDYRFKGLELLPVEHPG